jgi:hypothetical protein
MPADSFHGAGLNGTPNHNVALASRGERGAQEEGGGSSNVKITVRGLFRCNECGFKFRSQFLLTEHYPHCRPTIENGSVIDLTGDDSANNEEQAEEICQTARCNTVLTQKDDGKPDGGLYKNCAYHRKLANEKVRPFVPEIICTG